jgi:hypothetical protein
MIDEKQQHEKRQTEPLISWVVHPAKKRPAIAVLVSAFVALIAIGIYSWTLSPLFTALCTLVLLGSLSGFFFPTRYQLHDDLVIVKYTITSIKKEWFQYRSYYKDRNGVLLSPFATRSRLENFRGIYLRFDDCDRDKVMALVESKIKEVGDGS